MGTAVAVPPRWCSQQEILDRFSYRDDAVARKMFLHNGMKGRFMSLEPESFADAATPGFQQGVFQRASVELAEASVRTLLDAQRLDPSEVDAVVTITSYGFIVPAISAVLADRLGLRRDVIRLDLTGAGCLGAISLLEAADALVGRRRCRRIIAVASEVGSIFMRDGPAHDRGAMVINALMGDASVATLLSAGPSPHPSPRPRLLDTEYASLPGTLPAVDIRVGLDGTMAGHIGREVPSVARDLYARALDALLERNRLTRAHIRHWPLHPGSRMVIDAVQDALGLSDAELATSREVLREYGNVCSATALLSLHAQFERGRARRGEFGVLGGVGPGMTVGMTLFQYA